MACDGVPPTPCSRCTKADRTCQYRHLMGQDRGSVAGSSVSRARSASPPQDPPLEARTSVRDRGYSTEGRQASTTPHGSLSPGYPQDSQTTPTFGLGAPGHAAEDATSAELGSPSWTNLSRSAQPDSTLSLPSPQPNNGLDPAVGPAGHTAWIPNLFMSATAHTQPEDALFFSSMDSSADLQFSHPFDWGFTDIDSNIFESIGTHNPQPELTNSNPFQRGLAGPERDAEIVKALKAEEVDGQPNVEDLPNGSPEESIWVSRNLRERLDTKLTNEMPQ